MLNSGISCFTHPTTGLNRVYREQCRLHGSDGLIISQTPFHAAAAP